MEKRWWWNIGTYQKNKTKVVTVGGGTGLSTLLKGLKKYELNITAVVAVTDEGGSSGRLREEFNIPPPGDVRNNFIALSIKEKELEELFNYRFANGSLKGHTVGNIILTALTMIKNGSLASAVKALSEILAVKGKILPVSDELVRLVAVMDDGSEIVGETKIVEHGGRIKKLRLDKEVEAHKEVLESIKNADVLVFGPGSLYTSVITNLLVKGVKESIKEGNAKKVYVANIMTQPGETTGMKLSEHVRELERYLETQVDYVIVNSERPDEKVLKRYEKMGYFPVELDVENVNRMMLIEPMLKVVVDPYDNKKKLRHDPDKLAEVILKVLKMG